VLCEYSKFRIKSNSYFSIRFETNTIIRNTQGSSSEWCLSKTCTCTVLLLTMVQVLYLLEFFILAHYGPPGTETPATETTTVQCHKNSWIYLASTYYWWLSYVTAVCGVGWSMAVWKMLKFFKTHLHKFKYVLSDVLKIWCKCGAAWTMFRGCSWSQDFDEGYIWENVSIDQGKIRQKLTY